MRAGTRREFSERCAWQARRLAEAAEPRTAEDEAPGVNPGPKANDETDSQDYPKAGGLSNAKGQQ